MIFVCEIWGNFVKKKTKFYVNNHLIEGQI